MIQEYPNHKSIAEFKALQEKFKEDRINDLIAGAIQKAKDASGYNEKFKILEAVIQKYPDTEFIAKAKAQLKEFKEIYAKKTEEVKNILAYCSQPKVEPLQLKNKYGIDLTDVRLLSEVNITFRGIPDSDKLLKVLDRLQQIIAKRIISEGYKKVKATKTYEEMFQLLREIIASCPEHTPELKAVRQFLQNTG